MKRRSYFLTFLCTFILLIHNTYITSATLPRKKGSISGKVLNTQKEPLYPALIAIEQTSFRTYNNENGSYILNHIPEGNYILTISGIGFKTIKMNITVAPDTNTPIPDITVDDSHELSEVTVTGKSTLKKQQEQAYTLAITDASKSYNTSSDLAKLTNRLTGVRIREEGGVGSGYNFTLNGFSGNQVKFFMDGISMDNFGASFGLNNLPANLVERVEVYKGVLPVNLGADALGGAVNLITRKTANYLDVSYSFGSYNTHKASVNGGFTDLKTGFTARLNTFFNYSDNDYKVFVPIINLTTGEKGENRWVKRFHDGYTSMGMRFETGLVNKPFADYLLAGLILSGNDKDIQNGVVMDLVYGARTSRSESMIPSLRYKKSNLFTNGLDVSFYGAYSHVDYHSIDTVPRKYNWLGDWVPNASANSGERSRSQLNLITKEWRTNTTVDYSLNSHHLFTLNHVFSTLKREVSDIEDPANEYNRIPQSMDKHIVGLGWTTKYDRWNATAFGKLYQLTGKTYETNPHTTGLQKETKEYTEFGYGTAFTYFILPKLQTKLSYEHTYRLPEAFEMFGDNQENSRNADLKPESSHNINLGILYEIALLTDHTLQMETNLLFRDSKDFIHKELKQPSMMYVNLGKVLTKGIEANLQYSWKNKIRAGANLTYQHITDNRKTTPSQTIGGTENENFNYKKELPNIPYLFGNINLGFNTRNFLINHSQLTIDYFLNYTKEYYLSWPTLGVRNSKDEIPRQLSHDIAIGYSLNEGRYNLSLECNNLTNEALYDNFRLQKPGRSFNIKLRYYLSK